MCTTDECDEGRREFLTATAAAIVGVAAMNISGQQTPKYPHNEKVVTRVLDDPTISHGPVMFQHNKTDTIDGFLARPKAEGRYPIVIVIAGNVITEEYIPNTCAALAVAGYVGLAPNIFHVVPESAQTIEERRKASMGHSDSDAAGYQCRDRLPPKATVCSRGWRDRRRRILLWRQVGTAFRS